MQVEVQNKRIVFQNVFTIQEAAVRFQKFSGEMSQPVHRLVFERGDSAAALVFNRDTQKVLLINQFRYPTYEKGPGWIVEVVAGVVEEHEQPKETIRREIHEEIGYEVRHDPVPIATFYVSPGGTSERIRLYYVEVGDADHVAQGGGLVAEHEDIELVEMTLPDLKQSVDQGQIIDAKTLIAAQWLLSKMAQR